MKISRTVKEYQGCKFFPLDGIIECTYHEDLSIEDFWINRVLVEQDELIVELADLYDNDQTFNEILDYEDGEDAHTEFVKSHEATIPGASCRTFAGAHRSILDTVMEKL